MDLRIEEDRLFAMIEALPELQEVWLYWNNDVSDVLAALLSKSHKFGLKQINVHDCLVETDDDFKKITSLPWQISEYFVDFHRLVLFSRP